MQEILFLWEQNQLQHCKGSHEFLFKVLGVSSLSSQWQCFGKHQHVPVSPENKVTQLHDWNGKHITAPILTSTQLCVVVILKDP